MQLFSYNLSVWKSPFIMSTGNFILVSVAISVINQLCYLTRGHYRTDFGQMKNVGIEEV